MARPNRFNCDGCRHLGVMPRIGLLKCAIDGTPNGDTCRREQAPTSRVLTEHARKHIPKCAACDHFRGFHDTEFEQGACFVRHGFQLTVPQDGSGFCHMHEPRPMVTNNG